MSKIMRSYCEDQEAGQGSDLDDIKTRFPRFTFPQSFPRVELGLTVPGVFAFALHSFLA